MSRPSRALWGVLILVDAAAVLFCSVALVSRVAGTLERTVLEPPAVPAPAAHKPPAPARPAAPAVRTQAPPAPTGVRASTSPAAAALPAPPAPAAVAASTPPASASSSSAVAALPPSPPPVPAPAKTEAPPSPAPPKAEPPKSGPPKPESPKTEPGGGPAKARRTTFEFTAVDAKDVRLTGSFLKWEDRPLSRAGGGLWRTTLFLLPGTYRYQYVIDGKKVLDPQNPLKQEGFSLLVVPEN